LKVLVSAYACNPKQGSEEAVGWNWVRLLAVDHEVTVLTAEFHRGDIEEYGAPANVRFVYVPQRCWHYAPTSAWRKIEGSIAKPLMNLAYAHWQRDAERIARRLHLRDPFDLVHQLTYVGFRFPGGLWKLGIPFVWGPIGGIENTSWRLLGAMGAGGSIYYGGRNLINSIQRLFLHKPTLAARAAGKGVIAATTNVGRLMRRHYAIEASVISEITIPHDMPFPRFLERKTSEPLRLVWSGQHLSGKALNIGLDALSHVQKMGIDFTLHILGGGPKTSAWQKQARFLGISEKCVWHGIVARVDAFEIMSNSHSILITSLKDLTSTVLVEALALGLPVICPNHCGFPEALGSDAGILAPVKSVEALTMGIACGVAQLAMDEPLRQKMAKAAAARAYLFSFDYKLKQLRVIYAAKMDAV